MRPLWRNTLWLGFAAVCGVAGFWFGANYAIRISADSLGAFHAKHETDEALGRVAMALDVLDKGPSTYAEGNLRSALFEIGGSARMLENWWTCYPVQAKSLERAKVYLKAHPQPPDSIRDPYIARAMVICEKANSRRS